MSPQIGTRLAAHTLDRGTHPTREEEVRLFRAYQHCRCKGGKELIRAQIIRRYTVNVTGFLDRFTFAKRPVTVAEVKGTPFGEGAVPNWARDDLFQEGLLGLMRAIDRFVLVRGTRFVTLSGWHVYWGMVEWIKSFQRPWHTPRRVWDRAAQGNEIDKARLAVRWTSMDPDEVRNIATTELDIDSLDVQEVVESTITESLERREATLIRDLFVHGHTLQHVGEMLGVCRERIRQLRVKSLITLEKSRALYALRFGDDRPLPELENQLDKLPTRQHIIDKRAAELAAMSQEELDELHNKSERALERKVQSEALLTSLAMTNWKDRPNASWKNGAAVNIWDWAVPGEGGRIVATSTQLKCGDGHWTVTWHGNDGNGEPISGFRQTHGSADGLRDATHHATAYLGELKRRGQGA